ncbi:Pkinase-domain-containing protein [Xylona heveae TC161]|uniref:non-specific serine/threonine protein kinase n=1 Tax=Xylona heveae (strain CBS 132557 / TC161) TaxID=1328760 RepID=A0A165ABY7_XYLHT|nr:Pkinase-domain-containing protein [Xylona heveae TC161]KZF20232.1 Pkinase-domain-containing protein [Xylona heveae TC161]
MADEGALANHYQMLEELGSGSFGVVYKAIDKATGEMVAIKHIDLESSEDDIQEIQQEISVLSTCASPFVTQYKTCFLRGHKLWIVMEYLGGGSCLDLLKPGPFNEGHIAIICRELLLGLDYLHKEGKIHRDIKAANILLAQSGKVKLADFGVAAQLTNIKSQRNTFVGTPFWMAPEVIQQAGYDFKADIWSLGITAMELINGEPPNAGTHPMKVLFLIPKAPAPRLQGNNYSRDFKDFIASCLVKDPDRRPTAKDLLRHRFIRNAGKVEALQELIVRRQEWESARGRTPHPKFYEENMATLAPKGAHDEDDDEWVFDTVKAPTISPLKQTQRRRQLSLISDNSQDTPDRALSRLDLNAAPTPSPPSTARRDKGRRKSSNVQIMSPSPSRRSSQQKQPLVPAINFGNSGSTIRQFKRVSDNSPNISPDGSVLGTDENRPPLVESVTKEGLLGRRAFSKAIDPAFQEMHAQTSDTARRDALSRAADAWSAMDALDPEGEYQLLKLMMEKIQSDPRLSASLIPAAPPTPQKPKLVLAQNNPHLKNARRRQNSQVSDSDPWTDSQSTFPADSVPGMEHTKQLAEVLYGRWAEGLQNRWPAF